MLSVDKIFKLILNVFFVWLLNALSYDNFKVVYQIFTYADFC